MRAQIFSDANKLYNEDMQAIMKSYMDATIRGAQLPRHDAELKAAIKPQPGSGSDKLAKTSSDGHAPASVKNSEAKSIGAGRAGPIASVRNKDAGPVNPGAAEHVSFSGSDSAPVAEKSAGAATNAKTNAGGADLVHF